MRYRVEFAPSAARAFRKLEHVVQTRLASRIDGLARTPRPRGPVGDKLSFLKHAVDAGYAVVLCFIGISSAEVSAQRVAMRVSQGGYDVPTEKIEAWYGRTLSNLGRAIGELPFVLVYDNEDLRRPFRLAAAFEHGRSLRSSRPAPSWLGPQMPNRESSPSRAAQRVLTRTPAMKLRPRAGNPNPSS